ncbi:cell surface hyaluronidase CEMIP2-like [Babylonia areolata]|uniref:cell surface hyaluronidase CEMIP2-like n=1 Tax=Babylonia areolata TaxID=304850 RepID=UPI003FD2C0DD
MMMQRTLRGLVLLTFVTIELTSSVTPSGCPWNEDGLMSWSDVSTWGTDGIPAEGAPVVIRSGMSVLLDVTPPALRSVEIQAGGKLVWGDVEGLVLKTGHIQVLGEFIVGSDSSECRMERKARILLTGKRDSNVTIETHAGHKVAHVRKAIMAFPGSTLEMHGAQQKSWTKLAATIPSVDTLCATVFDVEESIYKEGQSGLHVIVWNPDGSVFDFNVFDTTTMFDSFPDYTSQIPGGKIVGVAVRGTIGNTADGSLNWESVYVAMETLGAQQVRSVTSGDSYAFVVVKGQTSTAQEAVEKSRTENGNRVEGQYVSYTDWSNRLQFSVRSVIDNRAAKPQGADFKVFNTDVIYPVIKLKDDVTSWKVGDQIVVASTDFEWRQAEVKTIMTCTDCQSNEVRVDGPFQYSHYGEVSLGVDERAEVGLLSRSVVVEGEMEDSCYHSNEKEADLCDKFGRDTFGAHIMVNHEVGNAHIQHVEIYHGGQQAVMGRYPLHFHMMGDAGRGQWFRNNSIHSSFQRCITVHGTNYSEVSDNVCYDHLGHGLFIEDSAEQHNVIRGNLVLGTQHGTTLLSDRRREWCHPHPVLFCE